VRLDKVGFFFFLGNDGAGCWMDHDACVAGTNKHLYH